ncbi:mechanosensitive ion channel domain-containing protein [Zhongshania aquimaris]|uniref:Mechanosensitive ion channel n=1 Tax=Zhongshania aquimaris TaxID=2857107 RepID=A0ABS6VQB7_9GAMM|nr:mechanosensitive ion channel domain-containing protein [Zhongshania aquimaris]MBW2940519.1 mechanosensitive ion channel [Zhongshania aquimaris]
MYHFYSTLLAAALAVAMSSACLAQDDSDLDRLNRAQADISQEFAQIDSDILRDRDRLRSAEAALTRDITPTLLEDARLDLASLKSRENGLKTRLKARRSKLIQLEEDISDSESEGGDPQQLSTMYEQREVLHTLINQLERLDERFQTRVALARQRLNLLQARFELPDLNASSKKPSGESLVLQKQIDALLISASTARRDAGAISGDTQAERAKRRLLELSALAAEEQAELYQVKMVRLQAARMLKSLAIFSGSQATPVRVIDKALDNIKKLRDSLNEQGELIDQKLKQFDDQAKIISQQGNIASGTDSTYQERLALINGLIDLASTSRTELSELLTSIDKVDKVYREDLASNASAELLVLRELPSDAQAWAQLGRNLLSLPVRVGVAFQQTIINIGNAFERSDDSTKGLCLLSLLALIFGGLQGRRLLAKQLHIVQSRADNEETAAWVPLDIIHRNLLSLLPPIFVIALGSLLHLRDADLILLLTPLLIFPVVKLSLDFINNLLDHYTPELSREKTAVLLLETRWVIMLSAILSGALIIAHTVALSPTVIDAIDRLSMLCLLLISLPLLHLRKLLLEGVSGNLESRMLRSFTLMLPILLVLCAITGLFGYVDLAQAIAKRLGWLFVVGVGLHFVRNIIRAIFNAVGRWFDRRDAESAIYWRQYILGPLYRIAVLFSLVLSAQLLFSLYQWNMQTPVVRYIPIALDTTLFMAGATAIKVKTFALALLVLFVAVWGAGWSKQVSYRWVYTGVSDQGIRNSLSTFTQYFVVVLGLVLAMKIIGLDLTALTVFAGALGVGIGFGMQQIVVNFISGILLLVERPLATTDLVNVDKYEGEVTRIGIRSLTVKTFDNQEVIIPNSAVITKPFTNWTRGDDVMRTILMVGISYDDDPHHAVKLVKELLVEHPAVLSDPGPKVLLWDYGDSALMIRVQFHSRIRGDVGKADLRSQLLFAIWDAFKAAGITIPYPQQDVHVRGYLPKAE